MLAFGLYPGQHAAQLTTITPIFPRLTAGTVPVAVAAIAVDAAALTPKLPKRPGYPFVPAAAIAGRLLEPTADLAAGQRVMGIARHGLQTTAWLEEAQLVPLPDDIDFTVAVSLMKPGLAVTTALLENLVVHAGQRLFVADHDLLRLRVTAALTQIFGLDHVQFDHIGQAAPAQNAYHAALDFSGTMTSVTNCIHAVMPGGTLATVATSPDLQGKVLRLSYLTARPKLTAAAALSPVLDACMRGQIDLPVIDSNAFTPAGVRRAYTLAQDPAQVHVLTTATD